MDTRPSLTGPLIWSAIALVTTAGFAAVTVPSLLAAMTTSNANGTELDAEFAGLLAQHEEAMRIDKSRFTGRSVFFTPRQPRSQTPPAPEAPTPTPDVEPEPEPAPAPPATRPVYSGPDIRSFIGNDVWFDDDLHIKVGEEQNGMKVLSVANMPRSAKVEYNGWEYDVPLFETWDGMLTAHAEGNGQSRRSTTPSGLIRSDG